MGAFAICMMTDQLFQLVPHGPQSCISWNHGFLEAVFSKPCNGIQTPSVHQTAKQWCKRTLIDLFDFSCRKSQKNKQWSPTKWRWWNNLQQQGCIYIVHHTECEKSPKTIRKLTPLKTNWIFWTVSNLSLRSAQEHLWLMSRMFKCTHACISYLRTWGFYHWSNNISMCFPCRLGVIHSLERTLA